jgi:hypothetical protein
MDPFDELLAACRHVAASTGPFFGGGYRAVAPDALDRLKSAADRAAAFRDAETSNATLEHQTPAAIGDGKPPRL